MTAQRQSATEFQVITLVRVLHPSGPEVVRVIDKMAAPNYKRIYEQTRMDRAQPQLRFYEWGPGRVRRAA